MRSAFGPSLLQAGVSEQAYTAVLVQGAGTFSVESVIQTAFPRQGGKLVLFSNGAYGDRIGSMAKYLDIETVMVRFDELDPINMDVVREVRGIAWRWNLSNSQCLLEIRMLCKLMNLAA